MTAFVSYFAFGLAFCSKPFAISSNELQKISAEESTILLADFPNLPAEPGKQAATFIPK